MAILVGGGVQHEAVGAGGHADSPGEVLAAVLLEGARGVSTRVFKSVSWPSRARDDGVEGETATGHATLRDVAEGFRK